MRKTFFILICILLLIIPVIVFSKTDKCFTGEQCFYEVENCTNGLFICFNKEGTPLEVPIIENIPPTKINFVPKNEGTIKIIEVCFDPLGLKRKNIEIEEKPMLSCSYKCETNENCTCNVSGCTDGLFILINKKGTPVDYILYSPINSISSFPYSYSFIPKEKGEVKVIALCFSPKLKYERLNIKIKKKIQTCSQLGGTCCPSAKICTKNKISGASDCLECCPSLNFCTYCIPGTCDTSNRKFCLSNGNWSEQNSLEYCNNCSHCTDGNCNCDENCSTCPGDCGVCPTTQTCTEKGGVCCPIGQICTQNKISDASDCSECCLNLSYCKAQELTFSNCTLDKSDWSITCDSNCELIEGKETTISVFDKNLNRTKAIADDIHRGSIMKIGNKIKFTTQYPSLDSLDQDISKWSVFLRCWNPKGYKYCFKVFG